MPRWLIILQMPISASIAVFATWVFYNQIRCKSELQDTEKYAMNFQKGNFVWAFTFLLMQFVFPYVAGGDNGGKYFMKGQMGIMLLIASFGYASILKYVQEEQRKYYIFKAFAIGFAGWSMFAPAVMYAVYLPTMERFHQYVMMLAYIELAIGELLFLKNNEWKFLPKHPK